MDVDVVPEPDEAERQAVERALDALAARERERDLLRSAWWRAGVRENVAPELDDR